MTVRIIYYHDCLYCSQEKSLAKKVGLKMFLFGLASIPDRQTYEEVVRRLRDGVRGKL
jgi:hypothetical protein